MSPREAILKDDIPVGIGLLWIYKWKHKGGDRWGDRWQLASEWIRKPRKQVVDNATLTRLAFMLVYRTIWRKGDVF